MIHTDLQERESLSKIPVRIHKWSKFIQSGDWWDIADFEAILEEGRELVHTQDIFKDRPLRIFFMVDDDFEINLEFWGERMETDKEFHRRQESLKKETISKKESEMERVRKVAAKHGFDLVKKEECF